MNSTSICRMCGGLIFHGNLPIKHTCHLEETQKLPAITVPPAEEITPERAEHIYELLCVRTTQHAANCSWCDALAEVDEICPDAQELWMLRRYWLKRAYGDGSSNE